MSPTEVGEKSFFLKPAAMTTDSAQNSDLARPTALACWSRHNPTWLRVPLRYALFTLLLYCCGCKDSQPVEVSSNLHSSDVPQTEAAAIPVASPWPAMNDADQFVGSETCRECHEHIADTWTSHPMSRSLTLADHVPEVMADRLDEFCSAEVPGNTRKYQVQLSDGVMVHTDIMLDADGNPIYSQSMPMDYIVGSGRRALAYLRRDGDLLFQSPLNWYSSSQKWDLAPGYRRDDPRRFRRRITDDCLSCHAGRTAQSALAPARYPDPVFHEQSIGCERCHGPGRPHVEYQHSGGGREHSSADPIAQLASLTAGQRESLCLQCHMTGEARILRHGRSEFDFRPGMLLSDLWSVLDHPPNQQQGSDGLVTHARQLHASTCWKSSDGKLSCVSCHDPHSVPRQELRVEYFRNRCQSCHETDADCSESMTIRQTKRNSCIDCHMPRNGNSTSAHVSQTDHRIQRRPHPDTKATQTAADLQLAQFPDGGPPLPQWEHQRALAAGLFSTLMRQGRASPPQLAELLQPALQQHPDDGLANSTLGALALQHGNSNLAEQHFLRAATDPQARESALEGLLDLAYSQGHWQDSLQLLQQLQALDPGHPGYHAIRADCLKNLDRIDEAVTAGERSLALDPSRIEIVRWLLETWRQQNRDDKAAYFQDLLQQMSGSVRSGK